MASLRSTSKQKLHVYVCTGIDGLHALVEQAFASSSLCRDYELVLQDVTGSQDEQPAEILLADPGKVAPFLESLQGLKWLQSTWAGINALSNISRRDFTCTRLAGCMGPQMSEYVFGAIFSKDWFKLQKDQDESKWSPEPFKKRPRLSKMTLGCLGVGDLGSVVAQRGQAFGMRTLGFASKHREVNGFSEVSVDLAFVLAHADIIVNLLPSTAKTRGLLDGHVLEACGKDKVFINVGRGDIVTEDSLIHALEQGWLQRAVLDVFSSEPLPATSRLWSHPSVQISPHISAISYPDDVAQLFIENLSLWLGGKSLRFVADLDKGY